MKKQKVASQKPKITYRVNEQIRVPEVRIIFQDGTQQVMQTVDARRMAEDRNTDLIEVQPNAEPPVCKFDNLGKLLFKMAQRDKDLKKKQKNHKPSRSCGFTLTQIRTTSTSRRRTLRSFSAKATGFAPQLSSSAAPSSIKTGDWNLPNA